MRIVVFGGAGFVGSAVIRKAVAEHGHCALAVDHLAANSSLASLAAVSSNPRFSFRRADIRECGRIAALLQAFAPDAIVHAAGNGDDVGSEAAFVGSWRLIEAVRAYWSGLACERQSAFRFVAVSAAAATGDGRPDVEEMLSSWHKASGLPVVAVRSAASVGPCQHPSALVPKAIIAALSGQLTPAAGGRRDWIHSDDLAEALLRCADKGVPGAVYGVTGGGRASPAEVAERVLLLVQRYVGNHAADFDRGRNAIGDEAPLPRLDASGLASDTGWQANDTLDAALSKTVRWYMANETWWRPLVMAQEEGNFHGLLRIA